MEEQGTSWSDGLSDADRAEALSRFRILRLFLEDGVPLATIALKEGITVRTARRWLKRYREDGLAGLARRPRTDKGKRQRDRVTRHGAAVIVEDDGQPRFSGLAAVVYEDIKLRVVSLPDGVRRDRFGAVDQIEGLAVGLRAFMRQGQQARFQSPDYRVDDIISGSMFP